MYCLLCMAVWSHEGGRGVMGLDFVYCLSFFYCLNKVLFWTYDRHQYEWILTQHTHTDSHYSIVFTIEEKPKLFNILVLQTHIKAKWMKWFHCINSISNSKDSCKQFESCLLLYRVAHTVCGNTTSERMKVQYFDEQKTKTMLRYSCLPFFCRLLNITTHIDTDTTQIGFWSGNRAIRNGFLLLHFIHIFHHFEQTSIPSTCIFFLSFLLGICARVCVCVRIERRWAKQSDRFFVFIYL